MEGLRSVSPACQYIADRLGDEKFTLIDVGCSGGIDAIWRVFGRNLRAFGFDPNIAECERLSATETLPGIKYVPAFVGLPVDDPIVQARGQRPYVQRSLWNRLSVARTIAIRQTRNPSRSQEELTAENQWSKVSLADPAAPIILPQFFRSNAFDDVDMIKIDVDGPDFDILQSLSDSIRRYDVLALGLEVNFVGSADATDNTFCNTDRFMRAHGFDLFALSVRPYSLAALPAPFQLPFPAQTQYGRPLQGDALYARDLGQPNHPDLSRGPRPAKLAKLAAIFAAMGLFDCAAEVFLTHRDRMRALLDVAMVLDLLCKEAQSGHQLSLSYKNYMAAFEGDDAMFYPSTASAPTMAGMSGNFHDPVSMLAAKSREADSLQERLAAAEAAMHAARSEADSLKNSTSWRLTRPLRSSVDFARRAVLSRTSKLSARA